jgi:peroxiredoxin (alkyl hydroperoxide reductase subunit C)
MSTLDVGNTAPEFELPALVAGIKQKFRLGDQRGKKHIVLAFYPFNWEPASSKHIVQYQLERDEFLARGAETVAICVESIMNTTAWEREIGPFDFVLCSDFWPHGEVAAKYGVLRQEDPAAGASERAVFLVDKSGKIAFRKLYEIKEIPSVQDVLQALRRL